MSVDRIITADARTVSGIEFFDAVTGSSPERRAEHKAKGAAFARELDERHEREMTAMRERVLSMLSPEGQARMKAQWAERADLDPKELPDGRFQVAA